LTCIKSPTRPIRYHITPQNPVSTVPGLVLTRHHTDDRIDSGSNNGHGARQHLSTAAHLRF